LRDGFGARVPVQRTEGAGQDAVEARQGGKPPGLVRLDETARNSQLVLQRDALLEPPDVLGTVEQEQISDLAEVDLPARALGKAQECLDAAEPYCDVQGIR